jgi:O-antigen ligase
MPAHAATAMIRPESIKRRVNGAILFVLFVYPIVLLSVRHGMSVAFVVLIALSLWRLLWVWVHKPTALGWRAGDVAFATAMSALFVATLMSQAYHSNFRLDALDEPSRFLFAIPIYLMIRTADIAAPKALEYGFPLGALAAVVTSVLFPSEHWLKAAYFVDSLNFGGVTLLLGFLCVLAINWTSKDSPAVLILKLCGFSAGIYGTLHSGARGAWIALPILAILLIWHRVSGSWRGTWAAGTAAATLVVGGAWLIPQVQGRFEATQNEIASLLSGNLGTSIGLRFQIWHAAWQVIGENLVAGVGPNRFPDALQAVYRSGGISARGLQVGTSQMHNEILARTAELGIPGLLTIMAIYLVPLSLALNGARSSDLIKRTAAIMCIFVVIAYFVFGLTIETFNLKMIATFYAATVAILLGIARNVATETRLPIG